MSKIFDNPQIGAFVMSFMVVLTFSGVLWYAVVHGISDNPGLGLLTGAIISAFSTVIAYWLGSSSGSKNKDDVIAKQADTANANAAVKP